MAAKHQYGEEAAVEAQGFLKSLERWRASSETTFLGGAIRTPSCCLARPRNWTHLLNSVLVNSREKVTPAKFSIHMFGSVSVSGSHTASYLIQFRVWWPRSPTRLNPTWLRSEKIEPQLSLRHHPGTTTKRISGMAASKSDFSWIGTRLPAESQAIELGRDLRGAISRRPCTRRPIEDGRSRRFRPPRHASPPAFRRSFWRDSS